MSLALWPWLSSRPHVEWLHGHAARASQCTSHCQVGRLGNHLGSFCDIPKHHHIHLQVKFQQCFLPEKLLVVYLLRGESACLPLVLRVPCVVDEPLDRRCYSNSAKGFPSIATHQTHPILFHSQLRQTLTWLLSLLPQTLGLELLQYLGAS